MSYKFVSDLDREEYMSFIENSSMVHFMQNYDWNKMKPGWGHFHCGLYKDGILVAVSLILVKTVFKGIKFFYAPRGYVIDFTDQEVVAEMTKNIKKLAKANKAYMVKIDPNFCIQDHSFKDEETEHNYSADHALKHKILTLLGYKRKKLNKGFATTFQPRLHIAVPLCDANSELLPVAEVKRNCSKRFKSYFDNYQTKRGVTFDITDDPARAKDLIDTFKDTEKKYDIMLRDEEYIVRFLENNKNHAYLIFADVDLNRYLEFLRSNKEPDEAKINEAEALKAESGDVLTLSGALIVMPYNKKGIRTSDYLLSGNKAMLLHLHTSQGLIYEIMKFSLEQGCHYCDLNGVLGFEGDPLTEFKRKFNGRKFEFAGEYDLPTSWMYYPINLCYPILLKMYRFYISKRYGSTKESIE